MMFLTNHRLPVYSPVSSALGVIFLIFRDRRQAIEKESPIMPIPAAVIKPMGTGNLHFTMPISLKNRPSSGFMVKPLTASPAADERTTYGINDSAVCRISCLVVKPRDFKIP